MCQVVHSTHIPWIVSQGQTGRAGVSKTAELSALVGSQTGRESRRQISNPDTQDDASFVTAVEKTNGGHGAK